MITIIKLTQEDIGKCNIQSCFVHPNALTASTEILKHFWNNDSSYELEN